MANPWFKFYSTDWQADPALRMCSLAARGLWLEMICLMHEATPYGHLLVNGQPPTEAQLAVLAGATPDQITALLGELDAAGVFSRTRTHVIYSRKMTRMAKKAATARNNGRKGGNPSLSKGAKNPSSDKGKDKGGLKPQKPEARSQIYGGGGRARAREADPPPVSQHVQTDREAILEAIGADPISGMIGPSGKQIGRLADMQEARRWRDELGLGLDEVLTVIREVIAAKRDGPPNTFSYFTAAMQRFAGQKNRPALTPIEGGQNDQRAHHRGAGQPSAQRRAHESLASAFARAIPDEL